MLIPDEAKTTKYETVVCAYETIPTPTGKRTLETYIDVTRGNATFNSEYKTLKKEFFTILFIKS